MSFVRVAVIMLLGSPIRAIQSPVDTSTKIGATQTATYPAVRGDDEVGALRAQLAEMRQHHEDLLGTVHWTLGLVGSVALLLVGYSWFANYRIYDRDKAALEKELRAINDRNAIDTRRQLAGELEAKVKSLEERLQKLAADEVGGRLNPLNARLEEIRDRNRLLELDAKLAEGRYWELAKVPSNAIDRYRELLILAVSHSNDARIQAALKEQLRLLRAGTKMWHGHVSELVAALDNLAPKFAIDVTAIKELIASGSCTY